MSAERDHPPSQMLLYSSCCQTFSQFSRTFVDLLWSKPADRRLFSPQLIIHISTLSVYEMSDNRTNTQKQNWGAVDVLLNQGPFFSRGYAKHRNDYLLGDRLCKCVTHSDVNFWPRTWRVWVWVSCRPPRLRAAILVLEVRFCESI